MGIGAVSVSRTAAGAETSVLEGDRVCYMCGPDPQGIVLGWQESLGKGAEAELRQISVEFICKEPG